MGLRSRIACRRSDHLHRHRPRRDHRHRPRDRPLPALAASVRGGGPGSTGRPGPRRRPGEDRPYGSSGTTPSAHRRPGWAAPGGVLVDRERHPDDRCGLEAGIPGCESALPQHRGQSLGSRPHVASFLRGGDSRAAAARSPRRTAEPRLRPAAHLHHDLRRPAGLGPPSAGPPVGAQHTDLPARAGRVGDGDPNGVGP